MDKIIDQLKQLSVGIDSVKLDPKNARKGHALDEIAKSLEEYGQRKPIVVNRKTGNIEAGNGTYKAAKYLGWTHVAAVFVDDDQQTAIGFGIADNRLSDLSVFDRATLSDLLKRVDEPFDIPGIDEGFINSIKLDTIDIFEDDGENEESESDDDDVFGKGSLEKEKRYPIAITLGEDDHEKWEEIKNDIGVRSDSKAFLAVMEAYIDS